MRKSKRYLLNYKNVYFDTNFKITIYNLDRLEILSNFNKITVVISPKLMELEPCHFKLNYLFIFQI